MNNVEATTIKAESKCKEIGCTLLKLGEYKDTKDSVIRCACGKKVNCSFYEVMRWPAGCESCRLKIKKQRMSDARKGVSPANKMTEKEHNRRLSKFDPNMICTVFVGATSENTYKCKVCKNEFKRFGHNALRFGCKFCLGLNKKTVVGYNAELESKQIPFKAFDYVHAKHPVKHECVKCGFTLNASPTNALKEGKLRCPSCNNSTVHSVKVKNRIFRVRGFERFAVHQIVKAFGLKNVESDLDGTIPKIQVGKKKHTPDFYIRNKNLMIEVKSPGTFGVIETPLYGKDPKKVFKCIQKKKKAALKAGYRYCLLLLTESGRQIKLPSDWEQMSRHKVIKHIEKDLNHHQQ